MSDTYIYDGGYSDEQRAADQEQFAHQAALVEAQAAKRRNAIAKLLQLGLTDDEIAALVG
jgi:hypothetical protein